MNQESSNQINNPHDAYFKSLLKRRASAKEFLRHYLPSEIVADLDLRTLERVEDSFVSQELRRYFSDLIFRLKLKSGRRAYVYILLEHKSTPEKWVALQLLGYEVKFWEQEKDAGASSLPVVIPVVVYHGRQAWNIALGFQNLFTDDLAGAVWRRYVPNFEYHLCDLTRYDDKEIAGTEELQAGLLLMKYIFRRDLGERLTEIISPLDELPPDQAVEHLTPIVHYLAAADTGIPPEHIGKKLSAAFPKTTGGAMESLFDMWKRQGLQEGWQQGLQQGVLQGKEAGVAETSLRLLKRRLGRVGVRAEKQILGLPLHDLEELSEALLDFERQADLTAWLRKHKPIRKARRVTS